jgi:hypothetical protein
MSEMKRGHKRERKRERERGGEGKMEEREAFVVLAN